MSWVGVITDAGRALYEQTVAGATLNIASLKLGSGVKANETAMRAATALTTPVTDGVIESLDIMSNGAQFRLRANAAPSDVGAYTLKEMGLFATSGDSQVLFAYCMDTTGIGIPSEATFPDFLFILTATLILDNTTELSFTIDPSASVSYTQFTTEQARVNEALNTKKPKQSAVSDPTASGTGVDFIASISQDANGVITVTKKTVRTMTGATSNAAGSTGLVPAPASGKQTSFLRGDGTWAVPTNTTYNVFSGATASAAGSSGLVPAPGAGKQASFLRGDGTWAVPTNTTYNVFTGATANSAGTSGLVPAPAAGKNTSFLRGDGTWAVPTNTTYTAGTGLTLNGTVFSISKANVSTIINLLDTGSSDTQAADYLITQSAGGGTADTTYYRRPASKVINGALVKAALGTSSSHGNAFLRKDGTWVVPTNTTYSAGAGLSLSGTTFSLATSGVTAGSYGPSAAVTGTDGTTINIPYITVDKYGRITAIANKVLTNKDTNTTYSVFTAATASAAGSTGLVPAPAKGDQAKFLRADKTWAVPTNTTYSVFTAATASAAGSTGLVPAPGAGKQASFLRGDGTWATPTNTTYSAGTGLSLSGTSFSLATSGVTAGSYGPSAAVTGNDGTTINIPYITVDKYGRVTSISNKVLTNKNTTYSAATTSANGLMSSGDKTKLNNLVEAAGSLFSLITNVYINVYKEVSTYSSRKFSDYSELIFVLHADSEGKVYTDSVVVPGALWASGKKVQLIRKGTLSGIEISYKSDTKITAQPISLLGTNGDIGGFGMSGQMSSSQGTGNVSLKSMRTLGSAELNSSYIEVLGRLKVS